MMKPNLFSFFTVLAIGGASLQMGGQQLTAAESSMEASEAANSRLPVDLARDSVGARLQVRAANQAPTDSDKTANRSAQALIGDDASLSYPLAAGATSVVVTLPKIEVLSRFNFISYEAAGQVSVSVSSAKLPFESADWKQVSRPQSFSAQGVAACPLGSVEARYVKIDFNTQLPGRIAGFGLFGLPVIGGYQVQPQGINSFSPAANLDCANLGAGAQVVSTSRGGNLAEAQAILDGNAETTFAFDAADPAPTVVVDLGARRSLNRVSCVYEAPAGKVDFYLADNPASINGLQRVSLNYVGSPKAGAATAPAPVEVTGKTTQRAALASVETSGKPGISRLSADFGGQSGRYLIAAFHPSAARGDFKDFKDQPHRDFKDAARDYKDFKDSKDAATTADNDVPTIARKPFKLTAVSAFGPNSPDNFFRQLPPPVAPPGNGGGVPSQPPFTGPPQGGGVVTP